MSSQKHNNIINNYWIYCCVCSTTTQRDGSYKTNWNVV